MVLVWRDYKMLFRVRGECPDLRHMLARCRLRPKLATRCCTSAQECASLGGWQGLAIDLGVIGRVSSASLACTCGTCVHLHATYQVPLPLARLGSPHVKIQLDEETG
jgi:hypothetical protein